MMNSDRPGGSDAGTIPAGVINTKTGLRNVLQLDERDVHIGLGHTKDRPALVLAERAAAVLATHGRLKVPIHHYGSRVAGIDPVVIGRQKIIFEIIAGVVDERAGAKGGAANTVKRHTPDFIA